MPPCSNLQQAPSHTFGSSSPVITNPLTTKTSREPNQSNQSTGNSSPWKSFPNALPPSAKAIIWSTLPTVYLQFRRPQITLPSEPFFRDDSNLPAYRFWFQKQPPQLPKKAFLNPQSKLWGAGHEKPSEGTSRQTTHSSEKPIQPSLPTKHKHPGHDYQQPIHLVTSHSNIFSSRKDFFSCSADLPSLLTRSHYRSSYCPH